MTTNNKAAQKSENNTNFADNTTGAITPALLRSAFNDAVDSYQQAPQVNPQVGTSYTFLVGDYGNLVTFNNANPVAVTLPQATGSFGVWSTFVRNLGAGLVTVTPTTSTIDGNATKTFATGQSGFIVSDGANYQSIKCGDAAVVSATAPLLLSAGVISLSAAGGTILSNNTNASGAMVAATQPALAATAAPGTPGAGFGTIWLDSTAKNLFVINDGGTKNHGVQTRTATASNWIRSIADDGSSTISQPAFTDISGTAQLSQGGTSQTTAAAARASSGLNVESFTGHGDSTYNILATDKVVGTNAAFTASRTWTLPAANAVNPGQPLVIADFQGTVTAGNTLIISRAGADTVNGATSVTLNSANGAFVLWSDGVSKWTAQAVGAGAASGVSSIGGLTGAVGLGTGLTTSGSNVALSVSTVTNSLGADVNVNNTSNFFDGPSTAQGTSGTWFCVGCVTLQGTTSSSFIVKLWDGTTVIDSAVVQPSGSLVISCTLSGVLASPAANIKISVKDSNNTASKILFNTSGLSKDSTLTVIRIA